MREGAVFKYGTPVKVSEMPAYPGTSFIVAYPFIWDNKKGTLTRFYQGIIDEPEKHRRYIVVADVSTDGGYTWTPRNTAREAGIENPMFENQVWEHQNLNMMFLLDCGDCIRIFACSENWDNWTITNHVLVSYDGIHFEIERSGWHKRGAEPGAGGIYSDVTDSYIIAIRPDWGARQLCIVETKDFKEFSEPLSAIGSDAMDRPCSEAYGMPMFKYKDMYLGFLWMFHGVQEKKNKFFGGPVTTQLTYSKNGKFWQRSLHEPFLPETTVEYPTAMMQLPDGEIAIFGSTGPGFHGFDKPEGTVMTEYRLREDGFICLFAEGAANVCTRTMVLKSDSKISLNIKAKKATVALLTAGGQPIEGFTHEDCIEFSGDSTKWIPQWKEKSFSDIVGKVFNMDIKFEEGELYSYTGDFENLFNFDVRRYTTFGTLNDNSTYL